MSEPPTLLLLHGLGATGAVWNGVIDAIGERWAGTIVAPDLPGHGRAPRLDRYSFGAMAAAVATGLDALTPVVAVGHSLGGVVALALASGWFGVEVVRVFGFGIKVTWSPEELERASALATRPVKDFDSEAEALDRFLAVAGLRGVVGLDEAAGWGGVSGEDGRFRLRQDPATNAAGAPDLTGLLVAARCPVRLGRGTEDAMVTREELRGFDRDAIELVGGHNSAVEHPAQFADLVVTWAPA